MADAVRFKSNNPWANLAIDLMEPVAQEVGKRGKDFLVNWVRDSRDTARQNVYDQLTDVRRAPAGADDVFEKDKKTPHGTFYTPGRGDPVKGLVDPVGGKDSWNVPHYNPGSRRWEGNFRKEAPEVSNRVQQWLYNNPETVSSVAGVAYPTAVIGGAALGTSWLFGDRSKPQSDYSTPVQPSGGYNPSVESALAASSAKYEIMQQKHANDMELQRLRQEAGRPGSSSGGSSSPYTSASDPGDPFGSELGSSPSLFGGDSGYRRPQRSSSGSSSSYGYMG